jgi:hypothetical protein
MSKVDHNLIQELDILCFTEEPAVNRQIVRRNPSAARMLMSTSHSDNEAIRWVGK